MRRSTRADKLPPPPPYAGPRATAARVARGRLVVDLHDGRTVIVPVGLIPGFAALPARALSVCTVGAAGVDIYFPALDEHVGVENLLQPELTLVPRVLPRVVDPSAIKARRRRVGG